MSEHAKFSPSSWARISRCSGSLVLGKKVKVVEEESEFAAEGTLAHSYFERIIKKRVDTGELDTTCLYDATEEMRDNLLGAVLEVDTLLKALDKNNYQIKKVLVEEKVKLTPNVWGTVDFAVLYYTADGRKRLVVLDLKYGQGVSVSAESEQIKLYAICIRATHEWDFEQATLCIYQPRIRGEKALRTQKWSEDYADIFERQVLRTEKKLLLVEQGERKAELKSGSHCRFCKGKALCPSFSKELKAGLKGVDFKGVKVEELTSEQRGSIVLHMDEFYKFCKAVYEYERQLASEGKQSSKLKLVKGGRRRAWFSDTKDLEDFLFSNGVTDIYNKKIKGIGELEKVLKKQLGLDKFEAEKTLTPFIQFKESASKLVSKDDKREAIEEISGLSLLSKL